MLPSRLTVSRTVRGTRLLIAATVLLAVSGTTACGGASVPATPATSPAATPSSSPATTAVRSDDLDTRVDIGGRSLHLRCVGPAGSGAATVIFEAGSGATADNWRPVLRLLPSSTRACAYDRAGLGDSDPPPAGEWTAGGAADDLDALLRAAKIEPPYVLVAHSLGPWISTLYTARHQEAVKGLILVDPRGPDVTRGWGDAVPAGRSDVAGVREHVRSFETDTSLNDDHFSVAASEAAVRAAFASATLLFGDRPVRVIAGRTTPSEWPDMPAVMRRGWKRVWQAGQSAYAAESRDGTLVTVESGHGVPEQAPESIVSAIAEVLAGA